MTYDEFIKKHNGVAVNYDGAAGKQCVDLATAYFNEVFGSGIKNFWFNSSSFETDAKIEPFPTILSLKNLFFNR